MDAQIFIRRLFSAFDVSAPFGPGGLDFFAYGKI